MLSKAGAKRGIQPVRAHAERLPFRDGAFHRVMVIDALHHFCDAGEVAAFSSKSRTCISPPSRQWLSWKRCS
jgi:hypothetical protein